MNTKFFITAAAGSLFAGCSPISVTDSTSTYYQLPASTTVVVRQTITIPPGTAHVTLQDGRIVDHLRRYEPFCQFEVNNVVDSEQQVRPGRFAAARIIRQQKLYGAERQPVLLAASTATVTDTGTGMGLLANHNDGPSFLLNEVHLLLQSAEQPDVRELRCAGGWAFPSTVAYPTLAEMEHVLGKLISIEIN